MKKFLRILPIILAVLFTACTRERLDIDVADVVIPDFKIHRLEQDLFEMHPDSIEKKTPQLLSEYGTFYLRFITELINRGGINDPRYAAELKAFLSDKEMHEAYLEVKKNYQDLTPVKTGLTDAFKP